MGVRNDSAQWRTIRTLHNFEDLPMDRTWISLEAAARILGRHPRTTRLILDGLGARCLAAPGVKPTWHRDDVEQIAKGERPRRSAESQGVEQ